MKKVRKNQKILVGYDLSSRDIDVSFTLPLFLATGSRGERFFWGGGEGTNKSVLKKLVRED